MNKLNIVLITCIAICAIIAGTFIAKVEPESLYAINGDVGNIHLELESHANISDTSVEESGEGYVYYLSDKTHTNIYLAKNGTILASKMAVTESRDAFNPQDINGTVVYCLGANTGEYKGQTRYIAFVGNETKGLNIAVSTPTANETLFILNHMRVTL